MARVVWEGETSCTAQELLRVTAEDEEELSALGAARLLVRQVLADGPRLSKELESAAIFNGIALRTYYTARHLEGVIASKEQTANGPWILTLPQSPQQDL